MPKKPQALELLNVFSLLIWNVLKQLRIIKILKKRKKHRQFLLKKKLMSWPNKEDMKVRTKRVVLTVQQLVQLR